MSASMKSFRENARIAIDDIRMQKAIDAATGRFARARVDALQKMGDQGQLRDHFKKMRSATIANLAEHLETFERRAIRKGVQVHWAEDGPEAAAVILRIAQENGVRLVAKSKSMTTEEIHLNQVLQGAGIEAVETDLGEWIVQLAGEAPTHIIAPAIHKTKEQVAELFEAEAGYAVQNDIPSLTAQARRRLRDKFLHADMGISGGNIAVAETGSIVLVTNEGNGRMITGLPRLHVALVGIEKVAPTWDDAALWLSLLARSATGQPLSIYTNFINGPRPPADPDGPEEVHVVFLDNGRSRIQASKYAEALECIRCGACLNVCPVYREAGGWTYGSPYSGPIGAVISPLLYGLEDNIALPQASSLCGACKDVCPARIDLPRMLVELRADSKEQGLLGWWEQSVEILAGRALEHKALMQAASRLGRFGQQFTGRDLPLLASESFHEWWQKNRAG